MRPPLPLFSCWHEKLMLRLQQQMPGPNSQLRTHFGPCVGQPMSACSDNGSPHISMVTTAYWLPVNCTPVFRRSGGNKQCAAQKHVVLAVCK